MHGIKEIQMGNSQGVHRRENMSNTDYKMQYEGIFQRLLGCCIEFKVNLAPKY